MPESVDEEDAQGIVDDIRRRDEERLKIQAAEGVQGGRHMLFNKPVRPEPLIKPKRPIERIDDEDELGEPKPSRQETPA